MALTANLDFNTTGLETFTEAEAPSLANRTVSHNGKNTSVALTGSTTPPVTQRHDKEYDGNTGTIDLTAIKTFLTASANMTGLKLQAIKITNKSTSATFSIAEGAANGYSLGGAAINCKPGGTVMHYFNDKLDDVAAADKNLDWTFTAGQKADLTLIFG